MEGVLEKKIIETKTRFYEELIVDIDYIILDFFKAYPALDRLVYFVQKSDELVKEFMHHVQKTLTVSEPLKIYAKRINENTIIVRFEEPQHVLTLISLFRDYDTIIQNLTSKNQVSTNVKLYVSFHQACFPDMYHQYETIETAQAFMTKHQALLDTWSWSRKHNGKLGPDQHVLDLARRYPEIIVVNSPFNEILVPNELIQEIADDLKVGHSVRFANGDLEFHGFHVTAFLQGKPHLTIYNQTGFKFPIEIRNGIKYGTILVTMKYLFLRSLNPHDRDRANGVINCLLDRIKESSYFIRATRGDSISSCERYYIRNWEKKPWNYTVRINPRSSDNM